MDDQTDSPYAVITERLKHPVFGVFTLIWVLSNWRIPFFLSVDDRPASERITEALNLYGGITHMLYIPAALTLFYVFISPLARTAALRYERAIANRDAVSTYKSELALLQNKASIAAESNEELESQLKQNAELIETARKEMKDIIKRREELKKGIQALLELSAPEWRSPLIPGAGDVMRHERRIEVLSELCRKFEYIEKLKSELIK